MPYRLSLQLPTIEDPIIQFAMPSTGVSSMPLLLEPIRNMMANAPREISGLLGSAEFSRLALKQALDQNREATSNNMDAMRIFNFCIIYFTGYNKYLNSSI